jgi:hypothetical protein
LCEDLLDLVLLADVAVAEELDGKPVIRGKLLGVATDLVPDRLGELGVVEDADLVVDQVACGGVGMADVGEGPRDDHPIQAGQDTVDLLGVTFDEVDHGQRGVRG